MSPEGSARWAPDACLLEAEAGRDENDAHFEIHRLDVLGAVGQRGVLRPQDPLD